MTSAVAGTPQTIHSFSVISILALEEAQREMRDEM
jgi:hypothetical protein